MDSAPTPSDREGIEMATEIGLRSGDIAELPPMSALTREQRALADRVCEQARTLDLRVRALARAVWSGIASRADGAAVYAWLVELDLADQVDAAFGLGAA
jgi:hypothetical protein